MPVVLIIFGVILMDLGFRGTEKEFAQQLGKDISQTHFLAWIAAIGIVGAAGYYEPARRASNMLIALIVIALALRQQGVFQAFASLITNPPTPAASVPLPSLSSSSSGSGSSGVGGGNDLEMLSSIYGGGGGGGSGSELSSLASIAAIAAA